MEGGIAEIPSKRDRASILYLAIAFFAGFVSQTFAVRLIFAVLMRVVSWLSGPAILVLGAVKISELFRKSQGF
jgi:hypothetical protein